MTVFIALAISYCIFRNALANFTWSTQKPTVPKGAKKILVPTNDYTPFFGHILALFFKLPGAQLEKWQKELGPTIQINMGVKPWIILGDHI
ncbi:hypothetical protein BDB00DRAFT_430340 [Zychaea mexicana]|uniref:uncharacterized protein n=1 Tax=Zychaea mexicana TaxID=64656 RepID=UPI0022FDD48A|nr:uncharacterized protein BDB00DRAFT_430340 [Zychaea mexicana]KAI9492553.1 hypothetical protein BDB00DRAFT_430340 [Zychaea mexicana]